MSGFLQGSVFLRDRQQDAGPTTQFGADRSLVENLRLRLGGRKGAEDDTVGVHRWRLVALVEVR